MISAESRIAMRTIVLELLLWHLRWLCWRERCKSIQQMLFMSLNRAGKHSRGSKESRCPIAGRAVSSLDGDKVIAKLRLMADAKIPRNVPHPHWCQTYYFDKFIKVLKPPAA
jgi:hypothetical protein